VQTFVESSIKKGTSKDPVASLRGILKRFVTAFSGQRVANIVGDDIESWLDSLKVSPISVNSYRTLLHPLLACAVKRRLCP